MNVPLTFRGRLPGVLVETALPERAEAPLRLDVAGFVGFAERGPVNTPVALEDVSAYKRIFGGELPVAVADGVPIFAHLPSAVRAFFDNGGRRCYVVRVAGDDARPNRLPLHGLVTVDESGDFRQVVVDAAWHGRWSDSMSVSTQLRALPLRIAAGDSYYFDPAAKTARLQLEVPTPTTLRAGDLLRLSFDDLLQTEILLRVASISVGQYSARGFVVELGLENVSDQAAFSANVTIPTDRPSAVEQLRESGWEALAGAWHPICRREVPGSDPSAGGSSFELFLAEDVPVLVGDLLRVRYASGEVFYFPVLDVQTHYAPPMIDATPLPYDDPILPEGLYRRVVTDTLHGQQVIGPMGEAPSAAERLRFDLQISEGEQTLERWYDLSFNPSAAFHAAQRSEIGVERPITDYWADRLADVQNDTRAVELAAFDGRSLRLRAPETATQEGTTWLPLAMHSLPTFTIPLTDHAASGKDGLDTFDPQGLFLDQQLENATVEGLMTSAEYILYIQQPPGALIKLHSLLAIDEVALIAAPDLAHRPWFAPPPVPAPPPVVPPPAPEPDRSKFMACRDPEENVSPPYNPEDAPCEDALIVPRAPASTLVEHNPCLQLAGLPELQPADAYNPEPLLAAQRALITICAARADALAILSVPEHFKRRELADWQTRLVTTPALLSSRALSYAAVYHGWTLTREETCPTLAPVRAVPPDGALCGVIAARERARGAWIAPANEALVGVIGLSPPLSDADWEDGYNRQINILRHQPTRFTQMSAFTLSADRLLVQISVRRLLIFLRKLALRRGQRFVFETNNERFRRQVQLSFERLLAALADRGALTAFEVVTNEEINTPNDEFNGRFLVALKIAPTLPIEFITVVMLRSGESLLQLLER